MYHFYAMSRNPRKDELKKAWREQQRRSVAESLPMRSRDLSDLLHHLAGTSTECDHTLRSTKEFLAHRGLDVDRCIAWLGVHGGYCDCEALANVEDTLQELRGEDEMTIEARPIARFAIGGGSQKSNHNPREEQP